MEKTSWSSCSGKWLPSSYDKESILTRIIIVTLGKNKREKLMFNEK